MSNITDSLKCYLNLSDIQFLAKLNPKKKETLLLHEALGSHIKEDGSIDLSESLTEKLTHLSLPSSKIKKWIQSLIKSFQDHKNTISPYKAFIPKEYEKLYLKFKKYTLLKKYQKWIQEVSSQNSTIQYGERIESEKVISVLLNLNPLLKSLQIHKEIKVFIDIQNSILNFKFTYLSLEKEIHIFLPRELESLLDEENLFLLFLMFFSRYLSTELLEDETLKKIEQKLIFYINKDPDFVASDMRSVFGNKWEEFLITYYSLKQIQELIFDRISIFLAGGHESISKLYYKLNSIKEESYESDGEIFLIDDLWAEHKFSSEITTEIPDFSVRKSFLQSYKGGYLSGKTIKKNKIWTSHDRKELKDLYF